MNNNAVKGLAHALQDRPPAGAGNAMTRDVPHAGDAMNSTSRTPATRTLTCGGGGEKDTEPWS